MGTRSWGEEGLVRRLSKRCFSWAICGRRRRLYSGLRGWLGCSKIFQKAFLRSIWRQHPSNESEAGWIGRYQERRIGGDGGRARTVKYSRSLRVAHIGAFRSHGEPLESIMIRCMESGASRPSPTCISRPSSDGNTGGIVESCGWVGQARDIATLHLDSNFGHAGCNRLVLWLSVILRSQLQCHQPLQRALPNVQTACWVGWKRGRDYERWWSASICISQLFTDLGRARFK